MNAKNITNENLKLYLKSLIGNKLDIEPAELEEDTAFFTLGVTSLISTEILNSLSNYFDNLSSTLLFEFPSIETLADHLVQCPVQPDKQAALLQTIATLAGAAPQNDVAGNAASTEKSNAAPIKSDLSDAIAIIGLGGKFPGAANHLELYDNLLAKKDCVSEIPADRWSYQSLFKEGNSDDSGINSKWGGFINDIDKFDAKFFKILPGEAEIMDPQQKLFLECAWETMEDGGYGKISNLPTNNIGVYAGVTWNEYSNYANEYGYLQGGYKGPGTLYWGIPNRTSFYFNFSGPSISIDTACSSSLVAIHLACQGIRNGDCEMALAGGVNLNLHPAKYLFLSKNHFLSTDGKCRSFGEGGDGYVPGEGVGIVLLKPLAKALEDNDHIYAVIRGTSSNHGGKVTGYTVPNPTAHKELILKTMERANIEPEKISYVECHGTGTDLGDPIEMTGLKTAFENHTQKKQFCGIGSVKSNIGHLEAAAGVAGLIKVLMSMKNGIIPASLHCEQENKKINFADSPFYLTKENIPWNHNGDETVIAGVSSFGAGGSNAHCIIESFNNPAQTKKEQNQNQLILFSGKSEQAVHKQIELLAGFFAKKPDFAATPPTLGDIAYTLAKREDFDHRLALVAESLEDLVEKLGKIKNGKQATGVFIGKADKKNKKISVFELADKVPDAKELEQIAAQWTAGEIKHLIIAGKDSRLASLPSYPFEKKRYWITDSEPLYVNKFAQHAEKIIHPLLDRNESNIDKGRFVKTLHKSEFILEDHLVADSHVVPGVCHLEIARAAGQVYLQKKINVIRNVWYSNKIDLGSKDALDVCCEIEETGDEYKFVIKENIPDGATVFSSGYIGEEKTLSPSAVEIDALKNRCDTSIDIPEFYNKFVRIGILQKHSFRVVEAFNTNGEEAFAKLKLPKTLEENFSCFGLHPALMDGAVQTVMIQLLHLLNKEASILPFSFEKVIFHKRLPETVYVHSKLENLESKTFSLQLLDDKGNVLVEFVHFILKEFGYQEDKKNSVLFYAPGLKESAIDKDAFGKIKKISIAANNPAFLKKIGGKNGVDLQRFDLNDKEQIEHLAKEASTKTDVPHNIIFSHDNDHEMPDGPSINSFIDNTLHSLFVVAKSCAKAEKPINLLFCGKAANGRPNPLVGAVASFFKAIKRENANLNFKLVLHDPTLLDEKKLFEQLLCEFSIRDAFNEIHYLKDGKRYIRNYIPIDDSSFTSRSKSAFKDGGNYIITGGLGGIGKIITAHILENYQAEILLVGRSKCDKTKLAQLFFGDVEQRGKIDYFQADLADDQQVAALTSHINKKYGSLSGVIHCAGAIQDEYLAKKEWRSFQQVLAPKIAGTYKLDKVTAAFDLDFFVLFSSISSTFGNLAQSDYSYANGFLDHFVAVRNNLAESGKRKGKSLAVNWPYWLGGGMRLSERQLKVYRSTYKVEPLATEEGVDAFLEALQCKNDQVIVLNGKEKDIQQRLQLDNIEQYVVPIEEENVQKVNGSDDAEIKQQIKDFISHLFIESLELEDEGIDASEDFEDLGIDSIAIIDIIQVLEKSKRFNGLPNTIFLENNSIDKVVSYFETNYPAADYSRLEV